MITVERNINDLIHFYNFFLKFTIDVILKYFKFLYPFQLNDSCHMHQELVRILYQTKNHHMAIRKFLTAAKHSKKNIFCTGKIAVFPLICENQMNSYVIQIVIEDLRFKFPHRTFFQVYICGFTPAHTIRWALGWIFFHLFLKFYRGC